MFYSNALSVRLKLLKIKKETRTIRRPPGKKEGGRGRKLCRETYPINVKAPENKKRVPEGRCLVSCSGTLFLLNNNVVDKLFGF